MAQVTGALSQPAPAPTTLAAPRSVRLRKTLGPYAFILPKLLIFAVFMLYPLIRAGVLTFEPHPVHVLAPHLAPPLILTPDEKLAAIEAAGMDVVIVERRANHS